MKSLRQVLAANLPERTRRIKSPPVGSDRYEYPWADLDYAEEVDLIGHENGDGIYNGSLPPDCTDQVWSLILTKLAEREKVE